MIFRIFILVIFIFLTTGRAECQIHSASLKAVNFYDAGNLDSAISVFTSIANHSTANAFLAWLNVAVLESERKNKPAALQALNKAAGSKLANKEYLSISKSIISKDSFKYNPSFLQKSKTLTDPGEKLLLWQFTYCYTLNSKSIDELFEELKSGLGTISYRRAKVLAVEASKITNAAAERKKQELYLESNRILEKLDLKYCFLYNRNVINLMYTSPGKNGENSDIQKYLNDNILKQNKKVSAVMNFYKARYYSDQEDYKQCLFYLEQANRELPNAGHVIHWLAFTYKNLNDYKNALKYYQILLTYPYYYLEGLIGAGNCAYKTGNHKLKNHYSALILKEISNKTIDLNNYDRIIRYFIDSDQGNIALNLNKSLGEKVIGKETDYLVISSTYTALGNYLWGERRYVEALDCYQSSILSNLPNEKQRNVYANLNFSGCKSYRHLITDLNNKGEAFYQLSKTRKDKKEEIRDLKESLKNLDLSIEQIYQYKMQLPTEEQKYLYSDLKSTKYPNIIRVCLELYNLTGDSYYHKRAFRYAEQGRATVMLSMLRGNHGSKIGMIPAHYKTMEDSVNFQISLLNQRISSLKDEDPAKYTLNTQVDKLAAKMTQLENIYREKYPSYYKLKFSSEVVNSEYFQSTLKNDECIIEFLLHRNFLISFYLDKERIVIATDTLRKINLAQISERFYSRTNNFSTSHYKPDSIKKFAEEAEQLYSILLKPFESRFKGKKITIIADNYLRKIPFEVLLTKTPDDYSGYKNLPYLIRQNAVYYAPSVTFLNELRQRPQIKSRARLLAIAPVYSSLKLNDTISRMLLAVRADTSVFGSLPNAQNEIKFAHSIAGGRYLTQKRATETRFKRIASNFDILHLATHGLLNSESSLQSKLLFADSHPHDDGFLHNYEIYNLKQESQLVILSACNTGSGKNYGGEDVISTGRGFLSSGSRSVIMTLWQINDQASFNLIKGFYQGLKDKLPVCDAMRQSKLNFLDQADKMHSHPYFWTGYIVYGDASIVLPVRNYKPLGWLLLTGMIVIVGVFWLLNIRKRSGRIKSVNYQLRR